MIQHGFDWGDEDPPHPYAVDRTHVTSTADELPEVVRLHAEGWRLMSDSPALAFLPAIWPREQRTWVPDRSTHYVKLYSSAVGFIGREPWSEEEHATVWRDQVNLLADGGVPPPPRGRLWLLRLPGEFGSMDEFIDCLIEAAKRHQVLSACTPEFIAFARREIQRLWAG